MPLYASIEDTAMALGEDTLRAIADFDGDRAADNLVLERALGDASAFADNYIPQDLLPHLTDPYPEALRDAVIAIAEHRIRRRRGQATEGSKEAYSDALAWLRDLAAGKAKLNVEVPPSVAQDAGYDPMDPESESQPRIWNRTSASKVF